MDEHTEETIRARAHGWREQAGKPEGREDEFWYQAERELKEKAGSATNSRRRIISD